MLPILLLFPLLFLAGLAFAYFAVMPAAVKFLLNFNDSQFNIQVRARDYYSFFSTTMLAGGLVFQLPLAILAVTRLGIVKVEQLTLEPPLRLSGHRDRRRRAARRRPGLDADRDGSAACSVRVEYLARAGLRPAGGVGRGGGALYPGAVRSDGSRDGERRMVFDIRRTTRHVVKVVYAILALLMGASLFLVVGPVNIGSIFGIERQRQQRRRASSKNRPRRIERKLKKEPRRRRAAAGPDPGPDQRRQRAGGSQLRNRRDRLHRRKSSQQLQAASEAWSKYLKATDEPSAGRRPGGGARRSSAWPRPRAPAPEAEANVRAAAQAQQIVAEAAAQPRQPQHAGDLPALLLRLQGRRRRPKRKRQPYANTKFERENLGNELDQIEKRAHEFQKQLRRNRKGSQESPRRRQTGSWPTRSAKATRSPAAVGRRRDGPRRTRTFNLELKRLLL